MGIFVGMMLFRMPMHDQFFAGHFEADHHFKQTSLSRVMVWQSKCHMTAGDAVTVSLKCIHVSMDFGFDGI